MHAMNELLFLLINELSNLLASRSDDGLHFLGVTLRSCHQGLDSVDIIFSFISCTVNLVECIPVLIHDLICGISKEYECDVSLSLTLRT